MDFLTSKVKPMYFKYLSAAFGSSLIASIYGVVDMAVVGQYHGPEGTAAISVISPFWNLIYSLGLLMGIGGSVLFSMLRGESAQNTWRSNQYFSAFLSKRNTLAFVRPSGLPGKLREIAVTGFSTFFIDVAMGILTVFFNRQIMAYLDTNALAVYGIVTYVGTFVQCCAYSAGQASQPIISANYGARQGDRIQETLHCTLLTIAAFGLFWTALSLAAPNLYIYIFTTPTPEVLAIAPTIIRRYCVSFLLLPLNIFSTYYFQALMKPTTSFIVSVSRGTVISGILIDLLPAAAGADATWFAMPITELVVAVYVVIRMVQCTKHLKEVREERSCNKIMT